MSDQRRPLLPVAVAAGLLFGFWVALSGKFGAFHLVLGLLTAVAVALATGRLYRARPQPMPADEFGRAPLRWRHFLTYGMWLGVQIFRSAIHVARVILNPRLPIAPRMVRITDDLPHPIARLTLAHSITLTPGTVTVDCDDEGMVVHAIDPESAAHLGSDGGPMADRVRAVFQGPER